MRIRTFIIAVSLLGPLALSAHADPQSHCEIYSKDFADARTGNVDKWQLLYRGAFNDCMLSYNAKPASDAPVAAAAAAEQSAPEAETETVAVVPKAAAKPKARKLAARKTTTRVAARNLIPGSEAWNSFCAAKYSSFNKQSGTYLSNSGKIRRCSTTR